MQTIVCLANIEWDFTWQRHQEIMHRLAASGCRVVFVENIGSRTVTVKDTSRLIRIVRKRFGQTNASKDHGNIMVVRPSVLPFHASYSIAKINAQIIKRNLERLLSPDQLSNAIFWVYLPNPTNIELLKLARPFKIIYDCVSNFKGLENGHVLGKCEEHLIEISDLVITDAKKLYDDKAASGARRLYRVPTGIDITHSDEDVPSDVKNIKGPIIGYIGSVSRWVDTDLIRRAALVHRDKSFVFVGPINTDVEELLCLKNVHFLGHKTKKELAAYLSSFDICIVPYRKCEFTDYVYPVKLVEYLTTEKPIVSTNLYEVSLFGDVLSIARDDEEFISLLDMASSHLINPSKRAQFVAENTWDNRFAEIMSLVKHLT